MKEIKLVSPLLLAAIMMMSLQAGCTDDPRTTEKLDAQLTADGEDSQEDQFTWPDIYVNGFDLGRQDLGEEATDAPGQDSAPQDMTPDQVVYEDVAPWPDGDFLLPDVPEPPDAFPMDLAQADIIPDILADMFPDRWTPPDVPPVHYPAGPYGTEVHNVIENLSFFDTDLRQVQLADFYQRYKVILINASAGWCTVCRAEMPDVQNMYEDLGGPGELMSLVIYFEDVNHGQPEPQDALEWKQDYDLTFPVLLDPFIQIGEFFDVSATPLNMLVDGETMEIVYKTTGYDPTLRDRVEILLGQ